jgi:hypothetical protein
VTIHRIQIYGERCSGTNYLECLISQNLRGVQIRWDFGWKHYFPHVGAADTTDCLFVIVYRNPFDWLRSLHRNPWHAAPDLRGLTFSEFIRREWWCIWDEHAHVLPGDRSYGTEMLHERHPVTQQRFANVIQMRSAKVFGWESLRSRIESSLYIRYEDLSANPEQFITTMSEGFGIEKTPLFRDVNTYKGLGSNFVPAAYDEIHEEDLNHIVAHLDVELENDIGYDVEAR